MLVDRERAFEVMVQHRKWDNPNLRECVIDAMLEFAAQEAERTKIDCTCAPHWSDRDMKDPLCEAHDLVDQQARRAAELRSQKEAI